MQRVRLSTLRDSSRPAAAREREVQTVAKRKYPYESLKGIALNPYDPDDPWIYAGDPFRTQLVRVHARTGKREVVSKDARRLDFVVATAFLPPKRKGGRATLVTVADQEYRWATLNVALTTDQFRPPFIVAQYKPR